MENYDKRRALREGHKFHETRMDEGWGVYQRKLLEREQDLIRFLVSAAKKSTDIKIVKIGGQLDEIKNVLAIPGQIQKDFEKARGEK